MHRFFEHVGSELTAGESIYLSEENAAHAAKVLRLRVGEEAVVCDGAGTDYYCEAAEVSAKRVLLKIMRVAANTSEPRVGLTLFQCLPKQDKLEFVIQKAVELGAVRIVPVSSQRCVAKMKAEKLPRLAKIAESAAKQSGRGIIPSVTHCMSLAEAVKLAQELDFAFVPYENEDGMTIKDYLLKLSDDVETGGIFIGPEGGFETNEIEMLVSHGIPSVTLGRRILRTETAGLFALTAVQYQLEL